GRRVLLPAVIPAALRTENVMVASNPYFHAVIPAMREVEAFAEQLLPSVFAVRCGGIGRRLCAVRIAGVELVVLRIHAGGRGIKNSLVVAAVRGVNNIEINARRIVHHVGIVFTGKDVTGSAHISRKLIDLIEAAVDHMSHEVWVTQVADHEIIGLCLAKPRELEIRASHPEAFALEPFDKMVADEPTAPAHQRSFSGHWFRGHRTSSRLFRNQVHAFRTMPYTACRLAWFEPSYRPSGETHITRVGRK